jgi:hypothetical protein
LVARPGENSLLGRPKSRLEDNIKMYLKGMVWKDEVWTHLALNSD